MSFVPQDSHLQIGAILYPSMDQLDFTGPFEVLSRLERSTLHVISKRVSPIRDVRGLILTPEVDFVHTPSLDVLIVPGGHGQEDLMDDDATLSFIRRHWDSGARVLSVCTGALLCGAAGLLRGKRATTHWRVLHLLPYFGAIPVDERVVEDGRLTTSAGVTAGIDGALRLAAHLRGDAAKRIQLALQYAPEPPFDSGHPDKVAHDILEAVKLSTQSVTERRSNTAERLAEKGGGQ